jgi:hypothetical protein
LRAMLHRPSQHLAHCAIEVPKCSTQQTSVRCHEQRKKGETREH